MDFTPYGAVLIQLLQLNACHQGKVAIEIIVLLFYVKIQQIVHRQLFVLFLRSVTSMQLRLNFRDIVSELTVECTNYQQLYRILGQVQLCHMWSAFALFSIYSFLQHCYYPIVYCIYFTISNLCNFINIIIIGRYKEINSLINELVKFYCLVFPTREQRLTS